MSRVTIYVDGFNLYHAIDKLKQPQLKWLNLMVLSKQFLEKGDTLVSVTYFTAVMKWEPVKAQRHREYMAALEATGVEVIESKFQKNQKYCNTFDRYCDFYEEKKTDVGIAVRVISDALRGVTERILLITADSDQIPLVKAVRDLCPTVAMEVVTPPGRLQQARELCAAATKFKELKAGRLATCLLPRNVPNEEGKIVARCPTTYLAA
jgi:uncharacterized LabA/DUF88 family protein